MYATPKNIDVVILCGGLGTRLKKFTANLPKPMLKIRSHSFLDIIIDYMLGFGFKRFILCIGYKGEVIKNYYKINKKQGVHILFSSEKEPLDTGGAVKKAKGLIKSNPFIVLNGDSFCKCNFLGLLQFHRERSALISIVLTKNYNTRDYGQIRLDNFSHVVSFNEKDKKGKNRLINVGVYVFDKKIFNLMPNQSKFSLERHLFPKVIGNNFYGYKNKNFFIDIGTPCRYRKAKKLFLNNCFSQI